MRPKCLIFDFDGVLAESNSIRFEGFRKLFQDFKKDQVEQLVDYVKSNGGLSRYRKIEYFFREIRKESLSEQVLNELAEKYSKLVKHQVINCQPVPGSLEFLRQHSGQYDMAVVSGSDQKELREVCQSRNIAHYFVKILGSPTDKKENIEMLILEQGWDRNSVIYIGDSFNDRAAAFANKIRFLARDSGIVDWKQTGEKSILDLHALSEFLK